ncbi:MAG: UDP-N-acetylglucosamine 2-epimerase (non-hydrolyzing) [Cellulosilyticum sp.]|nr:UDP-N-acetylglucosamine 2-epimerase (non-hydrolyzing) [Cellulosilyticum sp.]
MSKLKVMTIVGTRPEIIRLSEVIKVFNQEFDHILVHTGQNWDYTLNEIFFKDFSLPPPNYILNCVGENLGDTIGNIIHNSYNLMLQEKPNALLVLGDTNSCLSVISAKRLKIPIFHMEAGNRCFDENVPEEINRRLIDHIADINLPYTEHARRNLIAEGIKPQTVFVTGSPLPEVFQRHIHTIDSSPILNHLGLTPQKFILVSAHREENINISGHFISLMTALNQVADTYQLPIIFSTHPRTRALVKAHDFKFHPLIKNIQPLGYMDYNKLQKEAFCVLSDSGTLSEESSLLHFPAVSIRTSTEHPEGLEQASMLLGGITTESILRSIHLACHLSPQNNFNIPLDYTDLNVSIKVAQLVQSFTPLVRRT